MMASSVVSSMQSAYEIARYIHSFYLDEDTTTEVDLSNDKPGAGCTNCFREGPNSCFSQLEQGIVLLQNGLGEIPEMDTPLGRWKIANPGLRGKIDFGPNGRVTKIFKELERSMIFGRSAFV